MARSYDSIENEIAKARENLAATLDEMVDRVSPKNLAEEGKQKASALIKDPKVIAAVGGAAALVVGAVVFRSARKRKQRARLERYLASRG